MIDSLILEAILLVQVWSLYQLHMTRKDISMAATAADPGPQTPA
jgi:hypothetical protein